MKCVFCSQIIKAGSGKMFVRGTGNTFYYCSSKCEKSSRMGRDSRKLKWSRPGKRLSSSS